MSTGNRSGMPGFLVDWAERMNGSHRKMGDYEFSVTETLKDPTAIILRRRHFNDIVNDLQDTADSNAGTAVHESIEADLKNAGWITEKEVSSVFKVLDGVEVEICGRLDAYDPTTGTLLDIKNTKIATYNKSASGDDDDWKHQLNIYRHLLIAEDPSWFMTVDEMKILARITDLSVVKEKMAGNSIDKWRLLPIEIESGTESIDKALATIAQVISMKDLSDEALPICSDKYRFATKTWKIYGFTKDGKPKAKAENGHASYQSLAEAEEGFKKAGFTENDHTIKEVGGESLRCRYYCDVKDFCPHYKKMMEAKNG